ncbi:AlbA family DNA-binding domain-containing protein [Streptomyces sp. CB00072]|uniref:AlbA family DNA-binding domain-containing protein n=1 Tax=Streptomyces sp. CB00072 TaxID=1703928 RepID=UPI00093AED81|nr:ATP-binding protein [Streptomyces sp. CB00072]
MTLDVDHSKAFRTPLQLRTLVAAVKHAGSHDENDWIEWKSHYSLTEKQTKATLARHIIAMANRSVAKSSQAAKGCGYILVGVEPGEITGVTTIDLADLESGIRSYLGPNGPEWVPSYVTIEGKEVLVISVDPPKIGDPIHTLYKDFDKYYAGMIFVRRTAQTVLAGPGEVLSLTQRAQASDDRQSLAVEVTGKQIEVPLWTWLEETLETMLEQQREAVESGKVRKNRTAQGMFLPNLDYRSDEDYVREAERYLSDYHDYLTDIAKQTYAQKGFGELQLILRNPQERSYQQVRVEVEVPEGMSAFMGDDYSSKEFDAPRRPTPLGQQNSITSGRMLSNNFSYMRNQPDVFMRIERNQILCDVTSLRAEEILSLPVVHLMSTSSWTTSTVTTSWSITAVNAVGRTRGNLEIVIGEELARSDESPSAS